MGIYADTCEVLGIEGAIFERRTQFKMWEGACPR